MKEEECNCVRCGYCCTEMTIKPSHLMFPSLIPTEEGREFVKVTGLADAVQKDELIRIIHRCQHLVDKNECGIEDDKPAFCSEWKCRRQFRDPEWFKEMLGELALVRIEQAIIELDKSNWENVEGALWSLRLYIMERDKLMGALIDEK